MLLHREEPPIPRSTRGRIAHRQVDLEASRDGRHAPSLASQPSQSRGPRHELEGEDLFGLDPRREGVGVVEPLLECRPLLGQIHVEHGLTQLGARGVVHRIALRPPVHGDRELLPRQVGRAHRRPRRQVPHAHRLGTRAEPEGAVQEVAVDRPGERSPVRRRRGQHQQAQALQTTGQLPGVQPTFVADDAAEMRPGTRHGGVEQGLQAVQFLRGLEHEPSPAPGCSRRSVAREAGCHGGRARPHPPDLRAGRPRLGAARRGPDVGRRGPRVRRLRGVDRRRLPAPRGRSLRSGPHPGASATSWTCTTARWGRTPSACRRSWSATSPTRA